MPEFASALSHLECSKTRERHNAFELQNLSRAGVPLPARYVIEKAKRTLTPDFLRQRQTDMWRYAEMLPVADHNQLYTLGEEFTPLRLSERLNRAFELRSLYISRMNHSTQPVHLKRVDFPPP